MDKTITIVVSEALHRELAEQGTRLGKSVEQLARDAPLERYGAQAGDVLPEDPMLAELRAPGLLVAMRAATDQARALGRTRLPAAQRDSLVARYGRLLAQGLAANPPPQRQRQHRGRVKQSPARNLLERLLLGRDQALAFLDDLGIPIDNNQAERDLRSPEASEVPEAHEGKAHRLWTRGEGERVRVVPSGQVLSIHH